MIPPTAKDRIVEAGDQVLLAHGRDAGQPEYVTAQLASAVEALTLARERIREKCGMCDGHGFTVEVTTGSTAEHHPDCDGSCRDCPVEVPVQEQVQEPCEYCGRPIDLIDALITEVQS